VNVVFAPPYPIDRALRGLFVAHDVAHLSRQGARRARGFQRHV